MAVNNKRCRSLGNARLSVIERFSNEDNFGGVAADLIDRGAHCVLSRGCISAEELRESVPPALIAIGRGLGSAVSYADEFDGAFVHDIRPVKGHEEFQVSSTVGNLSPHVEDSYHYWPPDYLILACVETGRSSVPTTLTVVDKSVLGRLSEPSRAILSQAKYRFQYCYLTDLRSQFSPAFPVLDRSRDGSMRARYSELGPTLCDGHPARDALETFRAALPPATAVTLGQGDVLVLDNRRVVHSRPQFASRFDQRDRWLRRAYAMRRLNAHAGLSAGAFRTREFGLEVAPIVDEVMLTHLSLPTGKMSPGDFIPFPQAFNEDYLEHRVADAE